MKEGFSETVRQCFTLGETKLKDWDDYQALGFTVMHIPELIHILEITAQIWDQAGEEDRIEWAPIHAWRALAQLGAVEAVPAMLRLLAAEKGSDWVNEEIPEALAMLGPIVLGDLREFLGNPTNEAWARIGSAHALELTSKRNPESRSDCIAALCKGLEIYEQNDETVNGFIISYLADINAPETAPLVERVFQTNRVDLSVMGDYEEFQIAVGLLKERLTSPPEYGWVLPGIRKAFLEFEKQMNKKQREAEKKEKQKRKEAKKARMRHKKK